MLVTRPPEKRNTRYRERSPRHRRKFGTSIATRVPPNTGSAKRRRTFITHLVEFDYPERFVSEQAGHRYASTTAIYTGVSDDYRNRLVRRSLEARPELWEGTL